MPCVVPGMVSFPFGRDPVIPCTQVTLIGFGSDWKSDEGMGKGALVNRQRRGGDFEVSSSRPAISLGKGTLQDPLLKNVGDLRPLRKISTKGASTTGILGLVSSLPQVLISADDEMEESEAEEDLRRLTPLKPVKKKKHRFGLPV